MTSRIISGRNVFTGKSCRITVTDGVISEISDGTERDTWLAPGLVDLQVNGFRGIDLNRPGITPQDVIMLTQALRQTGVTTYLPTIITTSNDRISAALAAIAEARRQDQATNHAVPFVHLEGPWISPLDGPRGAHPLADVCPPDLAAFARWQTACDGLIGLVTLCPHWPDVNDVIAALTAQGVRVSIGHTHAEPTQITAAINAGARFSTHLGNGIAATLPRHPNAIWTQLADDRLTRMFIADGHHLSAAPLKAMLRAVGTHAAILVSDVVALAGLQPGVYDAPIGGRVELAADGRLSVAGTPYLAGAATPLIDTLPRAIEMAGLTLAEAVALATTNPGLVTGRGRLEIGCPADFIRFRWPNGAARFDLLDVITSYDTAEKARFN